MLRIQNLSVTIKNHRIIQNVSLQADAGNLVSIVGQNGAGKSTMLRAVLRFVPIQSGCITLQNQDIQSMTLKQLARQIAYLPQTIPTNTQCTVEEYILMGHFPWVGMVSKIELQNRLRDALLICRMDEFRHRVVGTLSGGEFQRVLLAQVIMQNTPIILLDEPARYLDLKHQILFEDILIRLRNEGKTIINVTHDLNGALRISDRAAMIKQGQIIKQGDPHEVINPTTIAEGFDLPMKTVQNRMMNVWQMEENTCPAH